MGQGFDSMILVNSEPVKREKNHKNPVVTLYLNGMILLNSEINKFVYLECLDRDLFSVGDVFYSNTKRTIPTETKKFEKLDFYKNFEKNLKINLIKEKLNSIHPRGAIDKTEKGREIPELRFVENILGKLSNYIQNQVSFLCEDKPTVESHQVVKNIKLKRKIKPKNLNVMEIQGLKKLYRYKQVLLFNKSKK
jgi:hypothetical protein